MNIIIIKQKLITSQNKIYRKRKQKQLQAKNSLTGSTLHHQSTTTDTDCMELSSKQYDDERLSRYAAAAASSPSLPMLR